MASVDSAAMSPSAISRTRGGTEKQVKPVRLSVARQDVVREREKCIPLRAGRKRVERLLGALGKLHGLAVRIVDRRVRLERFQQLVPLLGDDAARGDDVADNLASRAAVFVLLQVDERQRHLAFAQVAGN